MKTERQNLNVKCFTAYITFVLILAISEGLLLKCYECRDLEKGLEYLSEFEGFSAHANCGYVIKWTLHIPCPSHINGNCSISAGNAVAKKHFENKTCVGMFEGEDIESIECKPFMNFQRFQIDPSTQSFAVNEAEQHIFLCTCSAVGCNRTKIPMNLASSSSTKKDLSLSSLIFVFTIVLLLKKHR